MASKKAKDLAPKSSSVKGGRVGWTNNDNVTLVRAAKPAPKEKDLPARTSAVKGGGRHLNDNLTLVRAAKPTAKKRDLPSRKDVKGGKKIA